MNGLAWWQRALLRAASTSLGSALGARVMHHLDRLTYALSGGRTTLSSIISAQPIFLLTTIGAKTGAPRTVPLLGIRDGEHVILIASNWGQRHHPAWYYNLRAHPDAMLVLNGQRAHYRARAASGAERKKYWQRAVNAYAGYAAYEKRTNGRAIPIMVLTPIMALPNGRLDV
jgi:deazaflavin-dependent oxidoreductase (nitroreductase family)